MQDDKKLPASPTEPWVREFLELWDLKDPVFVDYVDLDEGYEDNFCHVSAKHAALKHGGKRVHGWALWQYDDPEGRALPVIVGDFHSVWETPDGQIKDVTPPKLGTRVLFLRDPTLRIEAAGEAQLLYHNRTNVRQASRIEKGNPVLEDRLAFPLDDAHLVRYCKKLGLADTSMLDDPLPPEHSLSRDPTTQPG